MPLRGEDDNILGVSLNTSIDRLRSIRCFFSFSLLSWRLYSVADTRASRGILLYTAGLLMLLFCVYSRDGFYDPFAKDGRRPRLPSFSQFRAIRIIVPLSMSLLQAGARSPRRRLLLSYREKKHTLFFFPSHTARQSARASRAFHASRDARRASSANGLGVARAFIHSFDRSFVRSCVNDAT